MTELAKSHREELTACAKGQTEGALQQHRTCTQQGLVSVQCLTLASPFALVVHCSLTQSQIWELFLCRLFQRQNPSNYP